MSGIFAYCQNFFQCCHARLRLVSLPNHRASPFLLPKLPFCVIFEFANDLQIEFARIFHVFVRTEAKVEYKTQTRQLIMDFIAKNPDRIFKASDIARQLPSISLSTIYRNLSRLEKSNIVQIVGAEENKELQYRYTGPGRCESKMHLVCKDCGKFFHLEGPALRLLMHSVARLNGFQLDNQQSVLVGHCAACSRPGR